MISTLDSDTENEMCKSVVIHDDEDFHLDIDTADLRTAIDTDLYPSPEPEDEPDAPTYPFRPVTLSELEDDIVYCACKSKDLTPSLKALTDHFDRTKIYGTNQIKDIMNRIIGKLHSKQLTNAITEKAISDVRLHLS